MTIIHEPYGMKTQEELIDELKGDLAAIFVMEKSKLYDERNRNIIHAVWQAQLCGMGSGFRLDPKEPEWPVAFIELPTGQVSWHLPQHINEWDGHTTEEKNLRINRFMYGR